MSIHSEIITDFVPRVDISKHTAAYKIWNYKFLCQMSQLHLSSLEHIERSGTLTTGDSRVDRNLATEKVQVNITIAAMAEYIGEGIPFQLMKVDDSETIYKILYEHLMDWKIAIESNPGIVEVPVEDLRKFDLLAAEIYVFARHYFREKPFHGKLIASLMSTRSRRGGISRNSTIAKNNTGFVNNSPLTHSPLADSISQVASERRKSWR